ncbi:hypothetical protein BGY98DRAFT_1190685 [Russula aff. rugulosa BPL654]|nr:hypothetical protein BGY98DRAFT_1190685 [Russula aff. rugulosa BPL654]
MHLQTSALDVQNISIASPLPSINKFNLPFSSPSAWQVTPTILTFILILPSFVGHRTVIRSILRRALLGFEGFRAVPDDIQGGRFTTRSQSSEENGLLPLNTIDGFRAVSLRPPMTPRAPVAAKAARVPSTLSSIPSSRRP